MGMSVGMQEVSKKVGTAIGDYDMIQDGDRIIVSVSGGQDSLSLLKLLQYRQRFAPVKYELLAVHMDVGIPGFPVDKIKNYFEEQKVPYRIEPVEELKKSDWEKDVTCFWCAWSRRKVLFQLAEKLGFRKVALGHHMDDIIETILMNIFFQGEISAMRPKQDLFGGKLTLIRPLAYIEEHKVKAMADKEGILNMDSFQCPSNDTSKRMAMKKLIADLQKGNPAVKKNIFRSLERIKEEYLLNK